MHVNCIEMWVATAQLAKTVNNVTSHNYTDIIPARKVLYSLPPDNYRSCIPVLNITAFYIIL